MLKINLSDKDDKKKKSKADETAVKQPAQTVAEKKADETTKTSSTKSTHLFLYLIVLLVIAVIAVGYWQKDMLLSLLPEKEEPVQVVKPPSTPPPAPVVQKEPDPTFVVLNKISENVPSRLWLTSAVLNYDGSYEIKGIAFMYEAIDGFTAALGSIGELANQNIPGKSKSSETVYNFMLNGSVAVENVPDILDIIPTDNLVALSDPVIKQSEEFGVTFSNVPSAGQIYGDRDMPFSLEGSFVGLKKVIAELCPPEGKQRIYRIVIVPSAPGKSFDKVKATFSLRTVSSI